MHRGRVECRDDDTPRRRVLLQLVDSILELVDALSRIVRLWRLVLPAEMPPVEAVAVVHYGVVTVYVLSSLMVRLYTGTS